MLMPIDYSRLHNLTAREFIAALHRDGFFLRRQSGSHQRYQHIDGRRVTVSFHRHGNIFRTGTLKRMLEGQARWNEDDLKRLGLLKIL